MIASLQAGEKGKGWGKTSKAPGAPPNSFSWLRTLRNQTENIQQALNTSLDNIVVQQQQHLQELSEQLQQHQQQQAAAAASSVAQAAAEAPEAFAAAARALRAAPWYPAQSSMQITQIAAVAAQAAQSAAQASQSSAPASSAGGEVAAVQQQQQPNQQQQRALQALQIELVESSSSTSSSSDDSDAEAMRQQGASAAMALSYASQAVNQLRLRSAASKPPGIKMRGVLFLCAKKKSPLEDAGRFEYSLLRRRLVRICEYVLHISWICAGGRPVFRIRKKGPPAAETPDC